MTDTKQHDLNGEPLPAVQRDVESEIEIIEYELFISEKWKLKARKDAIETIFEDNTDPDKLDKALTRTSSTRRSRVSFSRGSASRTRTSRYSWGTSIWALIR